MSDDKMPEWFSKFVNDNLDNNAFDEYDRNIARACFNFITRPENLAKIDSVKALVDIASSYASDAFLDDDLFEVLKPFQEGGLYE